MLPSVSDSRRPVVGITSPLRPPQCLEINWTGDTIHSFAMVSINLETGVITFDDDYVPEEAAKIFWAAVSELLPKG